MRSTTQDNNEPALKYFWAERLPEHRAAQSVCNENQTGGWLMTEVYSSHDKGPGAITTALSCEGSSATASLYIVGLLKVTLAESL